MGEEGNNMSALCSIINKYITRAYIQMQAASLCMPKRMWKEENCMMMRKHLAVMLVSNTEAHLVLIVLEHSGNHP